MMQEVIQSVVVGVITGAFSAGAVFATLRGELKYLRRDVNELRRSVFGVTE